MRILQRAHRRPGPRGAAMTARQKSSPSTEADDYRIARRCKVCSRYLTDPNSVRAGVGPTCATRGADG
ncbi:DUF6011 domain-containing protein [Mycolicibacterium fortuitum]|uniref:DUF6011 domain-containing protein n=2 Tax=Mycolicibacterium TaxID=1866885 RepID=UPI003AF946AA